MFRLPILNTNIENIFTRFCGNQAAKLLDFHGGCCFGLTSNYILYESLGLPTEFNNIISTLSQDQNIGWIFWGKYYPDLTQAITKAQEKKKRHPYVTNPDLSLLLHLRPFCESLLLLQCPENTILGQTIPFQDIDIAAKFLVSEHIEETALKSTPFLTAGLKPEGFIIFLSTIENSLTKSAPKRLFQIDSGTHIIALMVSLDGEEIFDQNINNFKQFFPKGHDRELAFFLNTHFQDMPFNSKVQFHENSVFEIREYQLQTSQYLEDNVENLKQILDRIPSMYRCSVNEKNFSGNNRLHLCAWANNIDEIREILRDPEADLNATRGVDGLEAIPNNITALHLACSRGNLKAVQLLLSDSRCSPGILTSTGKSPFWIASQNDHIQIMEELLSVAPYLINIPNQYGASPLYVAAYLNHYRSVKLLLNHPDVDINQRKHGGFTPLHAASFAGHYHVIQLLLSHSNTHLNIESSAGETALHMAATNGHSACASLLLQHGAVANDHCVENATNAGNHQIVQSFPEEYIWED